MGTAVIAQDSCGDDDCKQDTRIVVQTSAPDWLENYPNAQATVNDYLTAARRDYLLAMAEEPIRDLRRDLIFDVTYETVTHSETVVTLVFTEYVDYGGLYPLDSLTTFTFELSTDRLLTISDVLREDVQVSDVLAPFIIAELGEEAAYYVSSDLDERAAYSVFTLSEDSLTLLYPHGRSGPTHAGAFPVVIPLEDIADVLNPVLFNDNLQN